MPKSIQKNIARVQKRVKKACKRSNRNPEEIQIILVTKTVEPEIICQAAGCGYSILGENRVQEAERKIEPIKEYDPGIKWHFIGHLQSNKVNKVIDFASVVHSIDRMKIVQKMDRWLQKLDKTMDILIQVNVSGEQSKYGINPENALTFVEKASQYDRLKIKGFMTIGLFSDDWPKVRAGFRQLRELRDRVAKKNISRVEMQHLSMGMTNDFELAIEEGATMIRVGRAIFGERETPDSYYWPGIDGETYSPESN